MSDRIAILSLVQDLFLGGLFSSLLIQAAVHSVPSLSQLRLLALLVLFLVIVHLFFPVARFFSKSRPHICIAYALTYSAFIDSPLFPGLNLFVNGPFEGTPPWLAASNISL